MKKIWVMFAVLVMLVAGLSGCLKPEINIQELEMEVHSLINEERSSYGLPALQYDNNLANIARAHSRDMINRNFFAHTNPDGLDPTARAKLAGYDCYKDFGSYYVDGIAENIMKENLLETGYDICFIPLNDWNEQSELASAIVSGWMDSPGHRSNILTSTYAREGIGIEFASNDEVYVTQNFW